MQPQFIYWNKKFTLKLYFKHLQTRPSYSCWETEAYCSGFWENTKSLEFVEIIHITRAIPCSIFM